MAVRPGGRDRRTRWGRRLAAAAMLAGPPLHEWLRHRPPLDPLRFTLGALADEAAYGAGVWRGCARERLWTPLLPTVRWAGAKFRGSGTDPRKGALP
jgi:hypothetical protein